MDIPEFYNVIKKLLPPEEATELNAIPIRAFKKAGDKAKAYPY